MNDFNYAEGKKATLDEKFPYFEWVFIISKCDFSLDGKVD